jgi:predicted MFS family arabinose efflux permease
VAISHPGRDSDPPAVPDKPSRQRGVGPTLLYAVLSANAVSQVGDMMVAVALPWFVLKTTGRVVQMGRAGAAVGIGTLLSSISGGPLVDRFGCSAASFGAMLGAFGAGALLGTLAFRLVGHRLPRRFTFLTCLLLVAPVVMFGSLAATPALAALLVALAVSGAIFGPMNSLCATAIQETTPRVSSGG